MNGAILRKALARIDAKRQLANEEARNNLLKAYENLDFKDVYEELRSEEIDVAKREAYGEVVDYNRLNYLKDKQNHVLKTIGLKEEDIYPNYSCKKCGDTGYVKGEVCDCLKREITKELFEYSGFTKKLATFEQSKYNAPTVEFMKKWCNAKTDRKTVLIYGHTGTGKTFLTECIASKLMAKNKVVFFTTAFALNNTMLNYHISFDAQREEILKPYTTSEVLIIDDLGTEPMLKNVTKEYLYFILNERIQNNLSTIITTNLDPKDIMDTYGERVLSRLTNKKTSILISLDEDDLRHKKD